MTTSTTRVLALLEILQGGGTRTVADLAARLGVDQRTVRRYAGHLLELGVPVESLRGRYGGYRLAPGHRMPPLMLTDEEALAVLLGLLVAQRTGPVTASGAASESAAAKLRRVLPKALGRRLEALLETADFTAPPRSAGAREAGLLLGLAEAARDRRPVALGYTDRRGRSSERTVWPYGLVAHGGRWYLTAADPSAGPATDPSAGPATDPSTDPSAGPATDPSTDPSAGPATDPSIDPSAGPVAGPAEVRTFRLDRVTGMHVLPGSFESPPDFDPVAAVLDSLAGAPWAHEVRVRVRAEEHHVRRHLPPGLATLSPLPPEDGADWTEVRLRAERLDWIPAVLAALDRPFVIDRPPELRTLVTSLADRLTMYATASAPEAPAPDDH
ncbi:helix-turn-helix transcriptional regulator [Streptomyces griseoaurantiacus]|uniref:HTH domain-containing protein n=1 Tax=Streptomyces griseoaurantiacus TaxID=68213 RepID=A0A1G7S0I2_9ACTN|nr:WYL domain-containing protein [Streptomyces jietaisiensis]SDG16535.1 HTH domain-containing protein [Streptomyces jietaisiensis]